MRASHHTYRETVKGTPSRRAANPPHCDISFTPLFLLEIPTDMPTELRSIFVCIFSAVAYAIAAPCRKDCPSGVGAGSPPPTIRV